MSAPASRHQLMILAIVQARMQSSRLPGKVLLDLMGTPVVGRVVERVRASRLVDDVVVATTDTPADDALVDYLQNEPKCRTFRGDENDVLTRFYCCAVRDRADVVVRITADDPLKDPEIIDQAVRLLTADDAVAYCSNTLKPTFPEGLDVEVFRFSALDRAYRQAILRSDREHVTPFIWRNTDAFACLNFEHTEDLSSWRWTLDRPEDYEFMKTVYAAVSGGRSAFSYREVIAYLRAHPEILAVNAGIARNEGYLSSLRADSVS